MWYEIANRLGAVAFTMIMTMITFFGITENYDGYVTLVIEEPKTPVIDEKELECLAKNIYYEARNQSDLGKIAVGMVVLNRTKTESFPDTVCGVVKQKNQFSWFKNGIKYIPKDKNEYDIALDIAKKILINDKSIANPIGNATFYHATYVKPRWANEMKRIRKIDDHIFYVDKHMEMS